MRLKFAWRAMLISEDDALVECPQHGFTARMELEINFYNETPHATSHQSSLETL